MEHKLLSELIINGTPVPVPTGMVSNGAIGPLKDYIIIVLVAVGIVAALIFFILGAVKWILSGGDKEKLESARRTVIYSIMGLVIIVLSGLIITLIQRVLTSPGSSSTDTSSPNSSSTPLPPYDCPDGSQGYDCHESAPNDTYGSCPICSTNPSCRSSRYTLQRCSVEQGKSGNCYGDQDCHADCPQGTKGVAYCSGFNTTNPDRPGICVSNCIEIDPNQPGAQ